MAAHCVVTLFRKVINPRLLFQGRSCQEKSYVQHSKKNDGLPVIHAHAAGIDIGSRFHVVAVGAACCDQPVQTFNAFTADLHRMASWLTGAGIETVATESTGGLPTGPAPAGPKNARSQDGLGMTLTV